MHYWTRDARWAHNLIVLKLHLISWASSVCNWCKRISDSWIGYWGLIRFMKDSELLDYSVVSVEWKFMDWHKLASKKSRERGKIWNLGNWIHTLKKIISGTYHFLRNTLPLRKKTTRRLIDFNHPLPQYFINSMSAFIQVVLYNSSLSIFS